MEPLRTELKLGRRAVLAGLALAALSPIACLGKQFARKSDTAAPKGRLVSVWKNSVTYAPDTSRGGAVFPGLTTRVYLFGPDMAVPYIGDGKLRISIYDATNRVGNADPKLTDIVDLPADALAQFAEADFMGKCYTIFCPWFNYRSDVTHVYIKMEYVMPSGQTLFHQSGTLSVDHSETMERAKKGMPAYVPAKDQAKP